jgi:hypothetical protein
MARPVIRSNAEGTGVITHHNNHRAAHVHHHRLSHDGRHPAKPLVGPTQQRRARAVPDPGPPRTRRGIRGRPCLHPTAHHPLRSTRNKRKKISHPPITRPSPKKMGNNFNPLKKNKNGILATHASRSPLFFVSCPFKPPSLIATSSVSHCSLSTSSSLPPLFSLG